MVCLVPVQATIPSRIAAVQIAQWDELFDAINSDWDGSGTRIQVDFAGDYTIEANIKWNDAAGDQLHFQLNVDGTPFGPVINRSSSPMQGTFTAQPLPENGKLGVAVWADEEGVNFDMATNSWLGVKRTS